VWTNRDRLLVQALHLYERGMCPCGCGHPARISQDEKYAGLFSVQHGTCYARQALDNEAKRDRKPGPGELTWAEFDLGWERSFPS
jgi:hypothetical protein